MGRKYSIPIELSYAADTTDATLDILVIWR